MFTVFRYSFPPVSLSSFSFTSSIFAFSSPSTGFYPASIKDLTPASIPFLILHSLLRAIFLLFSHLLLPLVLFHISKIEPSHLILPSHSKTSSVLSPHHTPLLLTHSTHRTPLLTTHRSCSQIPGDQPELSDYKTLYLWKKNSQRR